MPFAITPPPETAALIVAGGSSLRFREDKLMAKVRGRPLLAYSLEAFAKTESISSLVLVVPAARETEFSDLIDSLKSPKLSAITRIVTGGSSRYQSVQRGIAALLPSTRFVAIHDGARPLITPQQIENTLFAAHQHGAAALGHPVTDTLHQINADGQAEQTVDRSKLWAVQTPQVFRLVDLIKALTTPGVYHDKSCKKAFPTDEVSIFLERGLKVHLVESTEPNIKVTYPTDLKLVEAYLKTYPE